VGKYREVITREDIESTIVRDGEKRRRATDKMRIAAVSLIREHASGEWLHAFNVPLHHLP
jgi:hypothetical protein